MDTFRISNDIRVASTLPSSFYSDDNIFEKLREGIFAGSWQMIGDKGLLASKTNIHPFTLLEEFLDEPLVLTRDDQNTIHCLSNVCTHRGNLVAERPGKKKKLVCRYHGRRFGLTGAFENMPEFEETKNFPQPCDNLPEVKLENWNQFLFANLKENIPFESVRDALDDRVGFLPVQDYKLDSQRSREYLVKAHWALYCDNFLEGFHIPFVHPDLNVAIDYGSYETVLYDYANLQIGYSTDGTEEFKLPENHIDSGKKVAAYYYWIFPNLMMNFYPWGLSINIVKPLAKDLTKVSFLSYVYDDSKIKKSAGALLDKVEHEDEEVVESVQKGINSRLYDRGRFSPTREKGVHHFHSLLSKFL